jgi:hypothetical protein
VVAQDEAGGAFDQMDRQGWQPIDQGIVKPATRQGAKKINQKAAVELE